MKYIVKSVEEKQTSTGKPMFKVVLGDTEGKDIQLNMFDKVEMGQELDGEIKQNDKGYNNFYSSTKSEKRPNMDRVMEKKADMIQVAQGNKERAVSHAQTRNEIMWAKYGAAEVIAHHQAYKSLELKDIAQAISKLANIIYHDSLQPFADRSDSMRNETPLVHDEGYDDMEPENIPF